MKSFLRIEMMGNLGDKPVLKTIKVKEEERIVMNGKIAVNMGLDQPAAWFSFEIWGKRAETASKYLDKGSKVLVSDAEFLEPISWIDKDGNPRTELKIRINEWYWLDSRKEEV